MDLPSLDFAKWTHGDTADRSQFAKDLAGSLIDHGFVKMINHGMSDEDIREIFDWGERFFKLPTKAKTNMFQQLEPGPQRGWVPFGLEQTSGFARLQNRELELLKDKLSDQRESYDMGPPEDLEFPNVWPEESEMPGFRSFMELYFKRCQEICQNIMSAIELGLDVAPGVLLDKIGADSSELRLNYYPSSPWDSLTTGLSKRCWAHTDFGLVTLLFQDHVGGLELEDRQNPGSFVPVVSGGPDRPTEMVLNTADCLSRWTNNKIRAGLHQVNIPYGQKDGIVPARYTCPFFYKTAYDVLIKPLPDFVSEDRPAMYPEITAIEYHKQRVRVVLQEAKTSVAT